MADLGPERPEHRAGLLPGVVAFYAVMALGAWGLAAAFDVDLRAVTLGGPEALPAPLAAVAGAASGLLLVLLSRPLLHTRAMAAFRDEVRAALGRPGPVAVGVLAAASALGEELLFRGTLHALIGLWPTVLIFGLLHGGGVPRLLGWTLFALGAGVGLGLLATWSGSLLAPIVMHFTVNHFNITALTASGSEARP